MGQSSVFARSAMRRSLSSCSIAHSSNMCSVVCLPFPHGQFGVSVILNLWREDLMFPWPVTMVVTNIQRTQTILLPNARNRFFSLSKAAKLNWGLNPKALKTIYLGGILPLLLYGAPVWCKAMTLENCKAKLTRVQRIINIKIAKAYRTVSNEALCV